MPQPVSELNIPWLHVDLDNPLLQCASLWNCDSAFCLYLDMLLTFGCLNFRNYEKSSEISILTNKSSFTTH